MLLLDALKRCLGGSIQVASAAVIVDVKNEEDIRRVTRMGTQLIRVTHGGYSAKFYLISFLITWYFTVASLTV